jgi:ribosomal protein S16
VSRESDFLKIAATIPAQNLSLQGAENRWQGTIDVTTAQRDMKGRVFSPKTQSAAVNINRESYEYYLQSGIPYSTSVKILAGAQEFRIVVVDRSTGTLGSVIIPLAEIR